MLSHDESWIPLSNAESGEGYSDILIETEDSSLGIVIELKYEEKDDLEDGCAEASSMIYHVAKTGNDRNSGTMESPFLTIQRAADLALPGDRVVVHEGVYREWVRPRVGGLSSTCRIVYEAAEGEKAVIKGSEEIRDWEQAGENVWKTVIPNSLFGEYNPYGKIIDGDWFVQMQPHPVHAGEVYLNGVSLFEAGSLEEVRNPQIRYESRRATWGGRTEKIPHPEQTLYVWYAQVKEQETVLYVNFQDKNPKDELVEINVRKSCFYPEVTGINYITVRGFEMAHAATIWSPPTGDQPGLIGPRWAKGWVIEDNEIHDSKCCAVSLGKEASTGDNEFFRWGRKPGYQYQMEVVFRAKNVGWDKERIGSHVVRRNRIHDCGQNGVVGHLGCIFSEIYENEIYNIAVKQEFWGYEVGGIKLHTAIDVQIRHNYIHNCSLGTWLDWQAQGARVSRNIYDQNARDLMIEVTHGPHLVDNNIFASPYSYDNVAQGGAYVNNLWGGFMTRNPVLNRATPYHRPHSTDVMGTALVYSMDDRWYQNIFVGGTEENRIYGTGGYSGAPVSLEEYIARIKAVAPGDVEAYEKVDQPVYINRNVYLANASAFDRDEEHVMSGGSADLRIADEGDNVYLEITLPEEMFAMQTEQMGTGKLEMTRITEENFENPDGSPIVFDEDLNGTIRGQRPAVGPLENVKAGRNRIAVWKR